MCLTIPYKIILQKGDKFVIMSQGKKKTVQSPFFKVKKGDYVLLQNGTIFQKIKAKEAKELLNLLN